MDAAGLFKELLLFEQDTGQCRKDGGLDHRLLRCGGD